MAIGRSHLLVVLIFYASGLNCPGLLTVNSSGVPIFIFNNRTFDVIWPEPWKTFHLSRASDEASYSEFPEPEKEGSALFEEVDYETGGEPEESSNADTIRVTPISFSEFINKLSPGLQFIDTHAIETESDDEPHHEQQSHEQHDPHEHSVSDGPKDHPNPHSTRRPEDHQTHHQLYPDVTPTPPKIIIEYQNEVHHPNHQHPHHRYYDSPDVYVDREFSKLQKVKKPPKKYPDDHNRNKKHQDDRHVTYKYQFPPLPAYDTPHDYVNREFSKLKQLPKNPKYQKASKPIELKTPVKIEIHSIHQLSDEEPLKQNEPQYEVTGQAPADYDPHHRHTTHENEHRKTENHHSDHQKSQDPNSHGKKNEKHENIDGPEDDDSSPYNPSDFEDSYYQPVTKTSEKVVIAPFHYFSDPENEHKDFFVEENDDYDHGVDDRLASGTSEDEKRFDTLIVPNDDRESHSPDVIIIENYAKNKTENSHPNQDGETNEGRYHTHKGDLRQLPKSSVKGTPTLLTDHDTSEDEEREDDEEEERYLCKKESKKQKNRKKVKIREKSRPEEKEEEDVVKKDNPLVDNGDYDGDSRRKAFRVNFYNTDTKASRLRNSTKGIKKTASGVGLPEGPDDTRYEPDPPDTEAERSHYNTDYRIKRIKWNKQRNQGSSQLPKPRPPQYIPTHPHPSHQPGTSSSSSKKNSRIIKSFLNTDVKAYMMSKGKALNVDVGSHQHEDDQHYTGLKVKDHEFSGGDFFSDFFKRKNQLVTFTPPPEVLQDKTRRPVYKTLLKNQSQKMRDNSVLRNQHENIEQQMHTPEDLIETPKMADTSGNPLSPDPTLSENSTDETLEPIEAPNHYDDERDREKEVLHPHPYQHPHPYHYPERIRDDVNVNINDISIVTQSPFANLSVVDVYNSKFGNSRRPYRNPHPTEKPSRGYYERKRVKFTVDESLSTNESPAKTEKIIPEKKRHKSKATTKPDTKHKTNINHNGPHEDDVIKIKPLMFDPTSTLDGIMHEKPLMSNNENSHRHDVSLNKSGKRTGRKITPKDLLADAEDHTQHAHKNSDKNKDKKLEIMKQKRKSSSPPKALYHHSSLLEKNSSSKSSHSNNQNHHDHNESDKHSKRKQKTSSSIELKGMRQEEKQKEEGVLNGKTQRQQEVKNQDLDDEKRGKRVELPIRDTIIIKKQPLTGDRKKHLLELPPFHVNTTSSSFSLDIPTDPDTQEIKQLPRSQKEISPFKSKSTEHHNHYEVDKPIFHEKDHDDNIYPHQYNIEIRQRIHSKPKARGPVHYKNSKGKDKGDIHEGREKHVDKELEKAKYRMYEHKEEEHWHEKKWLKEDQKEEYLNGKGIPVQVEVYPKFIHETKEEKEARKSSLLPKYAQILSPKASERDVDAHFAIPSPGFRVDKRFESWVKNKVKLA